MEQRPVLDLAIRICGLDQPPIIMADEDLQALAETVGHALLQRKLMLATAESCTGGWISQAITSVAGSSEWFDRGFVTYSYQAKREMLGVKEDTLARFGAVSQATVAEMAQGALASGADVALAVTGIAGPGGGMAGKPVGTVCFGWAVKGGKRITDTQLLSGDRTAIRRQAVILSLRGVLRLF